MKHYFLFTAFTALLLTLTAAAPSSGFGTGTQGCGADCAACHALTRDEAATVLKGLDPGTTVESVAPAPVRGLYQLVVKKGGDTAILYLDFSKKFLISGRVIDTGHRKDVTAEALGDLRHIDPATIPLKDALVLGNEKGTRCIYVFTDPQCPFCARLHGELVALTREDPLLKVYILFTPLDMHPTAAAATDAILCAAKESKKKGIQLLEESYGGKEVARHDCGRNFGEAGKKIGREFGVGLTPTMVFANGKVVAGARTRDEIRKILDEAEKTAPAVHPADGRSGASHG